MLVWTENFNIVISRHHTNCSSLCINGIVQEFANSVHEPSLKTVVQHSSFNFLGIQSVQKVLRQLRSHPLAAKHFRFSLWPMCKFIRFKALWFANSVHMTALKTVVRDSRFRFLGTWNVGKSSKAMNLIHWQLSIPSTTCGSCAELPISRPFTKSLNPCSQ